MIPLVFTKHPVDVPPATVGGRFGEVYDLPGGQTIHMGQDYPCVVGTAVYNWCPTPVRVVDFTNNGSYGIGVCLDILNTPWYALYAHLSGAHVTIGESVSYGQQLGASGNTGLSTGPHLHWQICKTKDFPRDLAQSADPLTFITEAPAGGLTEVRVRAIVREEALRAWRG